MARQKFPDVYGALWPNVSDGLRACATGVYERLRRNGSGTFDVWRTRCGALVIRSPSRPPEGVYESDLVGRYSASLKARSGAITPEMIYDDLLAHEGMDSG